MLWRFLLVLILFLPFGAGGRSMSAANFEATVMSFNSRYGSAKDGRNSWKYRRESVVECIEKFSPDVLGVQECLPFQAEFLDERLGGGMPGLAWIGM